MMKIESAKNIESDGLGVVVNVFSSDEEWLANFYLIFPDRDEVDLDEFRALIDGLTMAKERIQVLLEKLEDEA